ncbi:PaaI family thioesterase [Roseobacter sp. HKCCA0434]|uniref:PaaI family thioesterase n=1 Tax=Roseobacter sp. HKCCA0434 TaxID=3079297 RepID=UPI002905CC7D|nr:YiiD C-terminal domain-containing protein [Roseobacter sp. HKCCA0434]
MNPYDMVREYMTSSIPFARHAGVRIDEIGDGTARATLPESETGKNHIGTPHAGAVFTLGETASGAALGGALAPVLLESRPVAAEARISYLALAKGELVAEAKTSIPGSEALATLKSEGRVKFNVNVAITDETGTLVNEMVVAWHVRKT